MQDEGVIYVAGHPLNRRCIQDFQDVSAYKMINIVLGAWVQCCPHSLTHFFLIFVVGQSRHVRYKFGV